MSTQVAQKSAIANIANNLAVKLGMGEVGPELISTLKQTAFKGDASDAQFTALMVVANQYGLNPWTREIYAFPDKQNGIVPVVGVDGWSRIINEHSQFDGMEFQMPEDGSECTCIIYRKDRSHPIKVTEYKDECYRKPFQSKSGYEGTGPWQSHPKRMLRHKAMIQAARLAFGYTGIFDEDEAQRIVEKDVTAKGSHTTNNEPQEPVMLDDATFHAIAKKYKQSIVDGKKTVDDFIIWVETKGAKMTAEQKEEVSSWAVKQPQTVEGVATKVDDSFTTAYEQAESENA